MRNISLVALLKQRENNFPFCGLLLAMPLELQSWHPVPEKLVNRKQTPCFFICVICGLFGLLFFYLFVCFDVLRKKKKKMMLGI